MFTYLWRTSIDVQVGGVAYLVLVTSEPGKSSPLAMFAIDVTMKCPAKGNPMEKVLMASKREYLLRVGMYSRDVAPCCSIVKRMGDANEPSGRLAKLVLLSHVC